MLSVIFGNAPARKVFFFCIDIDQNKEPSFQQSLGQRNYQQSAEMTNRQQALGVRQEETDFSPTGPGFGAGGISQLIRCHATGREK